MDQVLESKRLIKNWREAYNSVKLSQDVLSKLYKCYISRRQGNTVYITSRPGIEVAIFVDQSALNAAFEGIQGLISTICIGDKLQTRYGPCIIIGARNREIWYRIENVEHSNW